MMSVMLEYVCGYVKSFLMLELSGVGEMNKFCKFQHFRQTSDTMSNKWNFFFYLNSLLCKKVFDKQHRLFLSTSDLSTAYRKWNKKRIFKRDFPQIVAAISQHFANLNLFRS